MLGNRERCTSNKFLSIPAQLSDSDSDSDAAKFSLEQLSGGRRQRFEVPLVLCNICVKGSEESWSSRNGALVATFQS